MKKIIKKIIVLGFCFSALMAFTTSTLTIATENSSSDETDTYRSEDSELPTYDSSEEDEDSNSTDDTADVGQPASGPTAGGNQNTKTEEVEIEVPASVTGEKAQGDGTVVDVSTNGSKSFYTIVDKDQNTYYLVIDLEKTENNVYFLSSVSKSDFDGTETGSGSQNNINSPGSSTNTVNNEDNAAANTPEEEEVNNNSFLIFILVAGGAIVAVYYFFVIKKKKAKSSGQEAGEEIEFDESYDDDILYPSDEISEETDPYDEDYYGVEDADGDDQEEDK